MVIINRPSNYREFIGLLGTTNNQNIDYAYDDSCPAFYANSIRTFPVTDIGKMNIIRTLYYAIENMIFHRGNENIRQVIRAIVGASYYDNNWSLPHLMNAAITQHDTYNNLSNHIRDPMIKELTHEFVLRFDIMINRV